MKIVKIIEKSIHVVELEKGQFTVHVYINGKIDAQYSVGSEKWAIGLALCIADGDDCKSYCMSNN